MTFAVRDKTLLDRLQVGGSRWRSATLNEQKSWPEVRHARRGDCIASGEVYARLPQRRHVGVASAVLGQIAHWPAIITSEPLPFMALVVDGLLELPISLYVSRTLVGVRIWALPLGTRRCTKPVRPPSMHRIIWRLIALLLIVALPAYAGAALALPETCPMQTVPATVMSEAGHTCCAPAQATDDESTQPGKGNPCKPGQHCKTGSLYHALVLRAAQAPAAHGVIAAVAETPDHSRNPAGIWRPPRNL